jgi:splicing factor 3B subunit 1
MSAPNSPRLVDSFSVPKDVLREFEEMAEEENIDPFAETASKRQIAARQSDYHNRRFSRIANESADAFLDKEGDQSMEGGYKEAMRLQRLEKEEQRVRRAIEEKEKREREEDKEDKENMDVDRTPPAAELEAAEKELAAAQPQETKRKRRWDVSEPAEKEKPSGEWSQEALESSALKKRRSRWDATPADVADTPKRSRWDQTPACRWPGRAHGPHHHECARYHDGG